MPPIPCAHCGYNFMRITPDPEAPKLCNNCADREEKRNPTKGKKVETLSILIECPKQTQIDIEEICINEGFSFSKYFLDLHEKSIKGHNNFDSVKKNEGSEKEVNKKVKLK